MVYLRTEGGPLTVVGEGLRWQPDPPNLLSRGTVADLDIWEQCPRGGGGYNLVRREKGKLGLVRSDGVVRKMQTNRTGQNNQV